MPTIAIAPTENDPAHPTSNRTAQDMNHHSRQPGRTLQALTAALLSCAAWACSAQELSYSAFGTAGLSVSDQSYRYQRFIDSDGTLKRDSLFGAQVDAQFTPEWSATLQTKIAPSMRSDGKWDVSASWAFASWRPSNEWLVRAGKVRIPLYLFSENLDVGQSYDFVRMPTEMYSIAPTTDITGLYVTRSWSLPASELSVDIYSGAAPVWVRFHGRDTGTGFFEVKTRVTGSVVTWHADKTMWRAGWHHAQTKARNGNQFAAEVMPMFGFYGVSGYTPDIANDIVTVGLDQELAGGWRLLFEFERNIQHKTDLGANTAGGYLGLLKSIDRWTPYAAVSALKSVGAPARIRKALDPLDFVPQERMLADSIPYYDQHSIAVGTSYALNPHSKIKAELMHTWVKRGSAMVDSPDPGPAVSNQGINVLSVSYNFAF